MQWYSIETINQEVIHSLSVFLMSGTVEEMLITVGLTNHTIEASLDELFS